jgi:hypothetical protein
MKYLILILLLITACGRAKWQDKEITDWTDKVQKICIETHVYYLYNKQIIAAVNDNNLPEKCHKIDGMK